MLDDSILLYFNMYTLLTSTTNIKQIQSCVDDVDKFDLSITSTPV